MGGDTSAGGTVQDDTYGWRYDLKKEEAEKVDKGLGFGPLGFYLFIFFNL